MPLQEAEPFQLRHHGLEQAARPRRVAVLENGVAEQHGRVGLRDPVWRAVAARLAQRDGRLRVPARGFGPAGEEARVGLQAGIAHGLAGLVGPRARRERLVEAAGMQVVHGDVEVRHPEIPPLLRMAAEHGNGLEAVRDPFLGPARPDAFEGEEAVRLGADDLVADLLRHLDRASRVGHGPALVAQAAVHVREPEGPGGRECLVAGAHEPGLLPQEDVHALPEPSQEIERVRLAKGDVDHAAVALAAFSQPLQAAVRQVEVEDGLRVGVDPRRQLRHADEPADGLVGEVRARVMMRERRRDLVQPVRVDLEERPRHPLVQRAARPRQEAVVGHFLREGVLDDVDRVLAGTLVQELEPPQLLDGGLEARRVVPHAAEQAARRLATDHGRRLQEALGAGGQAIDPRHDDAVDGVGDDPGLRSVLDDRARQLLQEERVALRLGQDFLRDGARQRAVARHRIHELRALARRQRPERDLGGVRPVHPRRAEAGARGGEEAEARARHALDERLEELLRRAVDPVQVLHHQQQRLPPAGPQEQQAQRLEGPRLHRLRRGGRRAGLDAGQPEQPPRRVRGQVQLARLPRDQLRRLFRPRVRADAALRAHEVDQREQRDLLAIGDRPALPQRRAGGAARAGQLVDQARLAHARLTDDGDDLAVAGQSLCGQVLQHRQLAPAAHERRQDAQAARAQRGIDAGQAPHAIGGHPAARRLDGDRLGVDASGQRAPGGLAQQDRAGAGELL